MYPLRNKKQKTKRDSFKQLKYKFDSKIKAHVSDSTRQVVQEELRNHVRGLQVQGQLLTLTSQEKEDFHHQPTYGDGSSALVTSANFVAIGEPQTIS